MALYERGGKWYADFRQQGGGRFSLGTSDQRVAREKHAELELAVLRGGAVALKPTGQTLGAAFEHALKYHYAGKASAKTVAIHRQHIFSVIPPTTPLDQITRDLIDAVVDRQRAGGAVDATIGKTMGTLNTVLQNAIEGRKLVAMPCKLPVFKRTKGRIKVFDEAEEGAILAYFRATHRQSMVDLCELLSDTGWRLGEALKWNIDHDRGAREATVWLTKNGEHRTIPLTERADAALERWLAGPRLTADQVHGYWHPMRIALGHDGDRQFVIHTYRHTCATRLAKAGWDVRRIMLWMGHKDIQTTLRYVHMTKGDLTAAPLERFAEAVKAHAGV